MRWLGPVVHFGVSLGPYDNGMLGEAGMKMKLIVGTAALVLSGCAAGPRLTWQNNGQYSTIDIERAFRVDDECRTWHRLATVPGNINTVKVLEREGVSACYRLRGCTMTACSAFSEPSWKGASH